MRLKLFRAASMPEAIARVRSEMGADALIVATRRIAGGVEITAAIEPEEPALPQAGSINALQYHGLPTDFEPASLAFAALPLEAPLIFIGPPGAGKTLTVARLATRLVMQGIQPLVITADGKRAGATEELAAFTKLLGIRLVVACHPVTLARALVQRDGPALIDTPGCNPFDQMQLKELTALSTSAGGTLVLVLPAGLDPAESADIAAAFLAIGVRHLIATRLDLSHRLGGILTAAAAGLVLTEAGVGPGAADGLRPITPDWLAERLKTGVPA